MPKRRRWISSKRSLRGRWPTYVIVLLFSATALAMIVLMLLDIGAPPGPTPSQLPTPIPAAIR